MQLQSYLQLGDCMMILVPLLCTLLYCLLPCHQNLAHLYSLHLHFGLLLQHSSRFDLLLHGQLPTLQV